MIEELIKKGNIKYITNENKNNIKEINECFYKLLASICYYITSDNIKLANICQIKNNEIEINYYCERLRVINKIFQNLNYELCIRLSEIYIIDELIKIIEIFKKINNDNNIAQIIEIKNHMSNNAEIKQTYDQNKEHIKLSEELQINFEKINNLLIKIDEKYKDKDF